MSTESTNKAQAKQNEKQGRSQFILHGGILAAASIIVRMIGVVYRIPMVRILGTEGSAYYSSAYKIYSIVLLISSYSMPLAISKLVSARLAQKQYKNTYRVIQGALLFALVVGGIASGVVFIFADQFAVYILNMPLAAIPLRVLAPAIFIMSFLGVYRGFFQGMGTMIPTALSQIFEQIINAAVSIAASYWLFMLGHRTDIVKGTTCYGASFGAAGGTLGTTLGALTALLFCLMIYMMQRPRFRRRVRRDRSGGQETMSAVMKALLLTIIPVLISSTAYNLLDIVDQSIFSYYMVAKYTQEEYSLVWGAYDNMYILMLHVPVAVASALASSSVPAITRSVAEGNRMEAIRKVKAAIRVSLLIALPSAVGLGVLAVPIMNLLFGSNAYHDQAAIYLMMGCIAVVFFSICTVTNGVLQGLGKIALPVRNAFIALAVHVMLLLAFLWLGDMKIYGVIFSYIVFGVIMSTLNILSIDNLLDMEQEWGRSYILPAVAAVVMGIAVFGVSYLTSTYLHSSAATVLLGMGAGAVIYALMLFGLHVVDEVDIYDMPKGALLVKAAKKLHLIR